MFFFLTERKNFIETGGSFWALEPTKDLIDAVFLVRTVLSNLKYQFRGI